MRSVHPLVQRVSATIERFGMFESARQIGVAVSGGADSVCLLHVLVELAPRWDLSLAVLHLDHRLRGEESRADAVFVLGMACRLGLPVMAREANLAGGNVEGAARQARLEFFREAIASGAVERVAVGHTRSDQAETVLFRLLRGSGTPGLAGVRPVRSDGIVRPLIEVERGEVEAHLREREIPWREDSTNSSRQFTRNRIRHELLPQLAREWNPEIAAALARTAEQARLDEEYWQREIDRLEQEMLSVEGGTVVMRASVLRELPAAAGSRLVRRAIERAKGDLLGVDFCHVEGVLRLAARVSGSGRVRAPRVEIRRSFDWLRFAENSAGGSVGGYRVEAAVPGRVTIPGTSRRICLELIENSETFCGKDYVYNNEMGCVDWGRVSGSLTLRNWAAGDRFRPLGSSGIKKLKTLFQISRIPSWERIHWPVLVDGEAVVWTRRFGPSADYAAGPETRMSLKIRETELA
jgi:tRNA(Ile)-lysidine synthase